MEEFEDDESVANSDPNDIKEDIDDDFDPNDTEEDIDDDFDPNDNEEDFEDDFDPNDDEEDVDDDFDPNDNEEDIDDDFDPNDHDQEFEVEQFDPNDDEEKNEKNEFDPNDNGEGIRAEGNDSDKEKGEEEESEEGYQENISSESTSTILVSEIKEEMQEDDQAELEREIEKELEEGVEGINKYLEEEAEFINAYQEMVGKQRALDEERELEGEKCQMTDEEWEKEVENAAYDAELIYESMEEIETSTINEEISEIKEDLEIEKEVEQSEEISEPQLSDLKEEVREQQQELEQAYGGREQLEQHQVEPFIKEELETEPESIFNEKEIEKLQELELEEQFQTVHLNEYVEEIIEKQEEEIEQLKEQEEKEELEAQASEIKEANSELYEGVEVERDALDQHEVELAIQEELETELEPIINKKEVKKLQELELEEQFQTVHLNEYVEEIVEKQEEEKDIENDRIEQEKETIEQTQEVIHQSTYLQEKLKEQEDELEWEYVEKEGVEQHQVEAAIEEELKTEPKSIINEEELEYIKSLEPEKQLEAELFYEFIEELANKQNEEKEEHEENEEQEEISTEQKVAQIMRELDIPQEINTGESKVESNSQEGELEQETTSPDEEVVEQLEIEENKDHQQELEEILEQTRKIEQEALNEIEQEEEDSNKNAEKNYERAKSFYKQQTGKRPIYANKETKGFKQWLEQKKKSEEKEKTKQKKELKEEQKKEETWKWFLKNWIERATEIDSELKSELKKLVEEYDELEKLIKKYSQLYNKAHRELLSQAEKNELKSLIKALQKIDPIKIELFLGIREIKRYLDGQNYSDFWDKPRVNRIRHHFFTQLSQIYKSLKQAQKKREDCEEILKNWLYNANEEEISPELKLKLKEIVENYSELEELATMFMKLHTKEQREKLSKNEKHELKSLTKTLQKLEFGKIELFTNLRAVKNYLNDQDFEDFSDKSRLNRILSHFFKKISQKYKNLTYEKQNLLNKTINLSDLKKMEKIDSFENFCLIYIITNQINGKVYIEKTIQKLKRRLQQHLYESRHLRKQTLLVYAIRKYGKENFEVEVVNFFEDVASLNEAEKYYIKKFKSNAFRFSKGYNMTDGGENFRILYGEEHPQFVNINIKSLKELIQEGHSIREMAEEFKVSYTVIQNRLNELGFVNIQEAREKLGGLKKRQEIRKSRMSQSAKGRLLSDKTKALLSEQRRGSNNHRFIIFKRNQLIEAIKECGKKKGGRFTLVDVANELKTTKNTVMHKVKQILGISFPEAKNQHFFAPKIKELIKNGRTAGEITKKLGYSERWLTWSNNKIRELWGLSFREAVRRFRVYPKINNDLLMSLISENLSVKEIDEVFIKILILSNTLKEITELLETNKDTIYKLVQQVFGFNNLTDARKALGGLEVIEFFEHSRRENISKAKQRFNISAQSVKSMIENGLKMREIAEKIGCSKTTIQVKIKELFNKKYSKLRDENYWKPLLKSLIQKNLSLNQIAHELNMKPKNLGSLLYRLYRTESICKLRERKDL